MIFRKWRTLTALLLAAPVISAAVEPQWLRYPSISPDGAQVAFSYQGQIWVVPADGGEAVSLTAAAAYSSHPVWSPDGDRIAFASTRHGNADVFVMPVEGGEALRLTFHSAPDLPMAFSPDGAEIYFSSTRIGDPRASADDSVHGLYLSNAAPHAVPVEGGRARRLWPTAALEIAPDASGTRFLYADDPGSLEDPWRKHQVSAASQDVWLFDGATGSHRRLTGWRGEDRDPSWLPGGGIAWLSERSGSFNVWRQDLDGGEAEQLTKHETWPVRFLSAANNGTLAYAWDGGLWRLVPGTEPERIGIRIRQDSLVGGRQVLKVNDQVSEIAVSPDGSEIALIARGEVFVTATASGATRRVTDTPALERFVTWAPDGRRLAYASERGGTWDIFEARLTRDTDKGFSGAAPLEEQVLIGGEEDDFQPLYAPDGKRIAYLRNRTELRVHDIAADTSVSVLPADATYSYYDGDRHFAWSPDGKWLTVELGFGPRAEIGLVDAAGVAGPVNISLNGFVDEHPEVSANGNIVLWSSDRFGLRAIHGGSESSDIYAAFLTDAAYAEFRDPTGDTEKAADSAMAAAPGAGTPYPDLAGLEFRNARLTPFSTHIVFFRLAPDNRTLYFVVEQPNGTSVGYAITAGSPAVRTVFTRPTVPGTLYEMDAAAQGIFAYAGGAVTRYDAASGAATPVAFTAEIDRDARAEIAALYDHTHRVTAETFYQADMHGQDWNAIGDHYRRFLPHIIWWEDVVELLAEAAGELNASHQAVSFHVEDAGADATASLGVYYDDAHRGPGMKIADVLEGGPADKADSALTAGAVILAVDATPITTDIDIHRLLNRKAGHEVLLEIAPADGGEAVLESAKPVPQLHETEYAYRHWVAGRRAMVAELSSGRLGYVHVRLMNLGGYQAAYGEAFGRYPDAEGLIVDVRANGGGNLHDQLITMLTGNSDSATVRRDGAVVYRNPIGRWAKPSAVIADANSYSDGSIFPTLYQYKGIGPVIGEPVPGTGTAVVRPPLVDSRLVYGIPELGFQLIDGRFFENLEVQPDVPVLNDPESIAAGKDLQLEAAVTTLLGIVDAGR